MTSVFEVNSLDSEIQLIMYLYVDNQFAYKSKTFKRSSNPQINLDIDM